MDGSPLNSFDLDAEIAASRVWEEELYRSLSRSRARAWVVASVALLIAGLSATALTIALPLKSYEPYVVTVDRHTGEAQIASVIGDQTLHADEALTQALIVEYLVSREAYDPADNEKRMNWVYARSSGLARQSWAEAWDYSNPGHPEKLYGRGQIAVHVKSVSFLDDRSASVRFSKTLRAAGRKPVTQDFLAIVGFQFMRRPGAISEIWENPLGFEATSYRVDQENLTSRDHSSLSEKEKG